MVAPALDISIYFLFLADDLPDLPIVQPSHNYLSRLDLMLFLFSFFFLSGSASPRMVNS